MDWNRMDEHAEIRTLQVACKCFHWGEVRFKEVWKVSRKQLLFKLSSTPITLDEKGKWLKNFYNQLHDVEMPSLLHKWCAQKASKKRSLELMSRPPKKRLRLRYAVGDFVAVKPAEKGMLDALVWIAQIVKITEENILVDWYELSSRGATLTFVKGSDPAMGEITFDSILMPVHIIGTRMMDREEYLRCVAKSLEFFPSIYICKIADL